MLKSYGNRSIVKTEYKFDYSRNKWVGEIEYTQSNLDSDTGDWDKGLTALMGASGDSYDVVFTDLNEQFTAYLQNIRGELENDRGEFLLQR